MSALPLAYHNIFGEKRIPHPCELLSVEMKDSEIIERRENTYIKFCILACTVVELLYEEFLRHIS